MKTKRTLILCAAMLAVLATLLLSCGAPKTTDELWTDAIYTENTELGEGETTLTVEFVAGEKKIVGMEVELREGLIYTLDGVGYTDLTITEPGKHTLLIEDGYGGSVEYEIYILNSAPTLQYALGENSPTDAEFDRTYYFKDRVAVSIPFEGDEFAMFVVRDQGNC